MSASARIVARAFTGTVRDGLSVSQDANPARPTGANPLTLVLGAGSAEVDLESYNGTIGIRRQPLGAGRY